jgi:hypothetical protein
VLTTMLLGVASQECTDPETCVASFGESCVDKFSNCSQLLIDDECK